MHVQKLYRSLVILIAALLVSSTAVILPAAAQQQNEIILSVDFDGTPSFGDPLDDGSGNGVHTPGEDGGANNNVVRTNDQVQYRIDWNVNEADGSTVTVKMVLPAGMTWLDDPSTSTGLPAGCASGSNTGQNGSELVCITDTENQGSNGAIHPRALVGAFYDGDQLAPTATVETDQAAPVVSNDVPLTVSARPKGDWVKGTPLLDADSGAVIGYEPDEEIFNIDNNGVTGRIFLWNLRLVPSGGLKGSEPMDDSVPIRFFDHMWFSAPSAVLATGLVPGGRTACGGYDGAGSYPFGSAGLGAANQTTAGTWTCTDLTATNGFGYPSVQIDITGHDTLNPPAKNANLSPNASTMISGQIAFWMSESDLQDFPVPQIIANAITGDANEIGSDNDVSPIQIHGTNGPVDEADYSLNNASPYEFPAQEITSSPGRNFQHYVRYQNGPYAEVEVENPDSGIKMRGMDRRTTAYGGTGYGITDGATGPNSAADAWRWDGDGQTPRGNIMTIVADYRTYTNPTELPQPFTRQIHGCVNLDPTHQELIPFAATHPVSIVDPHPTRPYLYANRPTIGGTTGTPTSPLAHVNIGVGSTTTWVHNLSINPVYVSNRGPVDYTVEFAAGAVTPGISVIEHGVTCNDGDEDGRGWVDSMADLSVFDPNGDGRYEDITHVRVRTNKPYPWHSEVGFVGNQARYGIGFQLNLQVRVKDNPAAGFQEADQELFVYASKGNNEWTGAPATPTCYRGGIYSNGVPTDGWCNLPFTDDGSSSTDITDFKNDYDTRAHSYVVGGIPRGADADVVYIVEPALAIGKSNLAGPSNIVVNGNIVEFEINPKVVGSSLDTIADVRITDPLSANYEFVAFTQLPSTPGATCSYTTQITCSFGTHPGGWSDTVRYQVKVKNAGANQTLKNTVTILGNDPLTGDPKTPATSSANSFTPAPYEESAIVKLLDNHLGDCPTHPTDDPTPAGWADRCEVIGANSNMVFELTANNEGNVDLENYRFIDVLPHLTDGTEATSATLVGDGRSPESAFTGTTEFTSITGGPAGTVYLYSADPSASISRDPGNSELINTWCDAPAGGNAVFGSGACPAAAADVTAVYANVGTIDFGDSVSLQLAVKALDNTCGDHYTNTFGARTDGLKLPIRSNDVTLMVGFCDPEIDIEKATNGEDADVETGPSIAVGGPVTWTYVVENTGNTAIADATVSDDQGVTVDCDVDGDGVLDGTNVIPFLAIGDSVTCEGTGVATLGQYTNNATVEGTGVVPDPETCGCDLSDPATWPTDPDNYVVPADPVTGDPIFPLDAQDPSHYIGYEPVPAIDIEKDTNGVQADQGPGPVIAAGDPVTWTYVIENTGTVPLRDSVVTDSQGVAVDCDVDGDGVLDGTNIIAFMLPGDTVTCEGTGVATDGQYENTASVEGQSLAIPDGYDFDDPSSWPTDPADYEDLTNADGEPWTVDDADDSHYFGAVPAIDIEKDTNGVQADTAPGPQIAVGDPVTWTYVVENTGGTALADATVTDSQGVTVDCDVDGDGTLDGTNVIAVMLPGDTVTCEGTGISTGGQYMNNAAVTGDPILPDADACGCDLADPATWPTDPDAFAPAVDADGEPLAPVEDDDDSHYFGTEPAIDIEKATNGEDADTPVGPYAPTGSTVTWTYVVENTGNTALSNATVTDSQGVTVDCDVDGDGTLDGTNVIPFLAHGASVTCEGTGPATAGQYTNNAAVTGTPQLPDPATCGCDLDDPSTWPTNAADFSDALDADGNPVAPVIDDDDSHYFGADAAIDIEKATNGEDADEVTGPQIPVGDPVTWTYVVENTGNTALVDATVTDDQGVTVDCDVDGDGVLDGTNVIPFMAPTDTVTCEGTGISTGGQYTNNAAVSGDPVLPDPDAEGVDLDDPSTWPTDPADFTAPTDAAGEPIASPEDNDDSHYFGSGPGIDIEKATNGEDADTVVGPQVPVGDPVTWTYVVENTGNTALVDATVTDDQGVTVDCDVDGDGVGDGTNIIALMQPGATVTCEGTGISTGGQYTNNASVTGQPAIPDAATCGCDLFDPATWPTDPEAFTDVVDADGNPVAPVDDNDDSHYFGSDPSIDIEKATNGEDADEVTGPQIPVGDPVTWTYVVVNDGNTALANATVTDNQGVTVDCDVDGDGVLDGTNIIAFMLPGDSVTCEGTGISTSGQYTNNASVSGDPQLPDPDTCGCDLFDPTTWPADSTVFTDVVDADGNPVAPVIDDDDSHYFGTGSGIDLEKSTNGVDADTPVGPQIPVGGAVTWTYEVANIGNTVLLDATVTDDQGVTVDCDVDGDGVLDGTNIIAMMQPGDTVTCEGTGVAVDGQYMNNASVTGDSVVPDPTTCGCDPFDPATWPEDPAGYTPELDANGEPVAPLTDEDPSHYFGYDAGIDIEKSTNGADADSAPGPAFDVGDTITWTYDVTNTGTVPLADATVGDDQGVTVDCDVDGDGTFDGTNVIPFLMPGATVTCEGTGTAEVGQYTNTGSVSGAPMVPNPDTCGCDLTDPTTWPTDPAVYDEIVDPDGNPVTPPADADPSNYHGNGPGIDIEKATNGLDSDEAPGENIDVGADVTWTYVVVNTGTIPIANATVTDDQGVTVDCDVDGDGTLDGTNIIALLLPGESVTCEGTGIAVAGGYTNNASVAGDLVLPDPATCGCDLDDPTTWPTDPALYTPMLDIDGNPVPGVTDEDPSNYTGTLQTLAGTVWDDADGDGILDPGETRYEGVRVDLLDTDGNPVLDENGDPIFTLTDANGDYSFDVPAGDYILKFTPPAGTQLTQGTGGDNDAADGSFTTAPITVGPGENIPDIDAGFVEQAPAGPLAFSGNETSSTVLVGLGFLLLGLLLVAGTTVVGIRRKD